MSAGKCEWFIPDAFYPVKDNGDYVSHVSVSLVAFAPHFGQIVSLNVALVSIGDFPLTEKSTSSGSKTGNDDSSTGTSPQCSQ